jgi:hypothetical protein
MTVSSLKRQMNNLINYDLFENRVKEKESEIQNQLLLAAIFVLMLFIDTGSLALELYHTVLLVVAFLVVKELLKTCQRLASWYYCISIYNTCVSFRLHRKELLGAMINS